MNSLKKGEGVPLLNSRGVPGLTFKLRGGSRVPGSRGPGPTFTPCRKNQGKTVSLYNNPN